MADVYGYRSRPTENGGWVQIDENYSNYGLLTTGTITLTLDTDRAHPNPVRKGSVIVNGVNPLVAFASSGGYVSMYGTRQSGGTWQFDFWAKSNTNFQLVYYVFDVAKNTLGASAPNALILRNILGETIFHDGLRPMKIVDFAASPRNLPVGRQYAVVQCARRVEFEHVEQGEEVAIFPDPGMRVQWNYTEHSAARVTGGSIELGLFNLETFWTQTPLHEPIQPNRGSGSMGWLILDVTGLGSGPTDDITLAAINWVDKSASTVEASGEVFSDTLPLHGINTDISIRVTGTLTGNLTSSTLNVVSATRGVIGSISASNSGSALSLVVSPSEQIGFHMVGSTGNGIRSGAWAINVQNESDNNATVDNVTISLTVDSDNNYQTEDKIPDAIDWNNISLGPIGEGSGFVGTNAPTVTGITVPINIRATISGLVFANVAATSRLDVFVNGSKVHDTSGIGEGYWAEANAINGQQVQYIAHLAASNPSQQASVSYTVTVQQFEAGVAVRTLDTFTVSETVNGADTTPDAMTWPAQSWSTPNDTTYGAYSNVGPTISGINRTVRLRFQIIALTSSASGQSFYIANAAGNSLGSVVGFGLNSALEIDVTNGTLLQPKFDATTTTGIRTSSGTMRVTNVTTGAVLGDFAFSITVDNDNNYNIGDYTPAAISVPTLSLNTPNPSGYTNDGQFQITGINREIVLRFTRGNQWDSGGIFTRRLFIYHSTNGGASYTEYFIGAGTQGLLDLPVNNGDYIILRAYFDTTSGLGQSSFTGYVTNLTTGAQMATFSVTGTVDNDNNYNLDYTPDAISFTQKAGSSNGSYVDVKHQFTITGISGPTTLKWTIGSVSQNANSSGLDIYVNYQLIYQTGIGDGFWAQVTVNNGDYIEVVHRATTNYRSKFCNYTVYVTNQSTGGNQIGAYNVLLTVDADDNFNRITAVPSNCYLDTPSHYGDTSYSLIQITGPAFGAHTLRFTRDDINSMTLIGNITMGRQVIGHSPGGTGGPWTWYLLGAGVGAYLDIAVNNGDGIYVHGQVETSGGSATASWNTYMTNLTFGEYLGSWNTWGRVDNDNNYNVAAPLTASLAGTYAYGSYYVNGGQNYQSTTGYGNVVLTVNGGVGTKTITWELFGGSWGSPWSYSGTTHPTFGYYGLTNYHVYAQARAKIVDQNGTTVYTPYVDIDLSAGNEA